MEQCRVDWVPIFGYAVCCTSSQTIEDFSTKCRVTERTVNFALFYGRSSFGRSVTRDGKDGGGEREDEDWPVFDTKRCYYSHYKIF